MNGRLMPAITGGALIVIVSGCDSADSSGSGGSAQTGTGGSSTQGATSSSASQGGSGAQGGMGGSGGQGGSGAQGGPSSSASQGGSGAQGGMGGSGGQGGSGAQGGMGGSGGGSGLPYPTGLTAVIQMGDVSLTWTNADPQSGYTVAKLLRTLNMPPTGPDDAGATVVYTGPMQAAAHPLSLLLPDMAGSPHTYHYAVYGCTPGMVCETMGSSATLAPTLRECLIGGGYNIFWRHASANVCSDNTSCGTATTTTCGEWWKSCDANCSPPPGTANARQLNPTGVIEAQAIGQSFTTLGIPVDRVLSSEFCRCMQTAQYMAFGPAIEQTPQITYYVYDEVNRCNNTMALLAQQPTAYKNVALVSHAGFLCPTLDSLAWGEAAIYKPDGAGGSILIASVLWNGWDTLP